MRLLFRTQSQKWNDFVLQNSHPHVFQRFKYMKKVLFFWSLSILQQMELFLKMQSLKGKCFMAKKSPLFQIFTSSLKNGAFIYKGNRLMIRKSPCFLTLIPWVTNATLFRSKSLNGKDVVLANFDPNVFHRVRYMKKVYFSDMYFFNKKWDFYSESNP